MSKLLSILLRTESRILTRSPPAQVQTILELNVAHAIEARLCNDIGAQSISLPQDAKEAADIQASSSNSSSAASRMPFVKPDRNDHDAGTGHAHHRSVYEQAYSILQSMAEAEADKP